MEQGHFLTGADSCFNSYL